MRLMLTTTAAVIMAVALGGCKPKEQSTLPQAKWQCKVTYTLSGQRIAETNVSRKGSVRSDLKKAGQSARDKCLTTRVESAFSSTAKAALVCNDPNNMTCDKVKE